jgi:membrane-bound metal-dependent hydrolase YbcI (DUF457 family)
VIFYAAWTLGLVPVAWLAWLARRGQRRDAAWWYLAGAFFVSWIADAFALAGAEPRLMSLVYPVSQASLVGAVLLERDDAVRFVLALVAVGIVAVLWRGVDTPDVFVRTVAWASIGIIAFDRDALGRLRLALLVAFGFGWLAWIGYTVTPGWDSWLCYQGVRALGAGTFCWAAWNPAPRLRIA